MAEQDYSIHIPVASGARLEIRLFNESEHRWFFRHTFQSSVAQRREKPSIVNTMQLCVDYQEGISQECRLSMDIIRPERRGKTYLYGVDVSEGSHLFVTFYYEKQRDFYRMKKVDMGSRIVDLDTLGEGLLQRIEFPFPVKDRIENEFGTYKVPFLRKEGEEAFFEFPENYQK